MAQNTDITEAANLEPQIVSLIRMVKSLRIGKKTRTDLYVHRSVIGTHSDMTASLDPIWLQFFADSELWNITKFSLQGVMLSLLNYPGFDSIAHPCLATALKIDFENARVTATDYRKRDNRPILHRKELFVDLNYHQREEFHALTVQEEDAGLLFNANQIGHQKQWEQRLSKKGFTINGHSLCG